MVPEAYTIRVLSPVRKLIAARMAEATKSIPHFRLVADLEIDALLVHRQDLRGRRPDVKVSINDLLIKACAKALMRVPDLNVQWVDGTIHQYHTADIAVVTALEDGLSTPIIRSAETKSVWDISLEIKDLVARARANSLKMTEIVGGSFSISNLGTHGVDQFDAIINSPQCAMLAVGRARQRVVVTPEFGTRIASFITVTLSVDHRAIDGAMAAHFLSALRQQLEIPV